MTTVLIQPAGPRDQAMHKDQHEALRAALEAQGLVKRYLGNLRRPPSGEPRTATIYGPGGEVLATVELEADDSAKVVGPEG
jgi:hypothetical protein